MKRGKKKQTKADENLLPVDAQKEKRLDFLAIFLLLGFGIYHSIIYWGHQPVPHFDFRCFTNLGREILNFQMPSSFKRLPLLGILQIALGKISGGTYSDFTGGWLLNSILHPLNAVLIFLIAKRIVPKAAFWIALIAMLNPLVLQLLTESIAETALLFGFLITFYFIVKRSNWVYLCAGLTSMIRYEGAVLIFIAFVLDMINASDNKKRFRSFLYAAAASVPIVIWLVATFVNWQSTGSTHYFKEFGQQSGGKIIFLKYLTLTWGVTFRPLMVANPLFMPQCMAPVYIVSKIIIAAGFVLGCIFATVKKNYNVLAMIFFLTIYLFIHAVHSWTFQRFCMPIMWIPLVVFCYGVQNVWKILKDRNWLPAPLQTIGLLIISAASILLITAFTTYLPKISSKSQASIYIPSISSTILIIFCVGRVLVNGLRRLPREITIAAFVMLMIISNQITLAYVVGNGDRDIEFRYLLDWYLENAEPGEKMALTVPIILQTMSPDREECFVHTNSFDADNPKDFANECRQRNISYVAWDSRMGLVPRSRYYKSWKMSNIAPLQKPADSKDYEFIKTIVANRRRYINLFKLKNPRQNNPRLCGNQNKK
ncbi:MAG: hypothetical protein H8D47_01800 [Planctomycetes bacterium]|nr:hypothetical protein [Planctomycetota bacterium]